MIRTEENPAYLNSFLEYSLAYQRKSPNSVEQYNCDLVMFLRYMKYHFKLTDEKDFEQIQIKDFSIEDLKRITQEDIHTFITYLSINRRCGPATCAKGYQQYEYFLNTLQ